MRDHWSRRLLQLSLCLLAPFSLGLRSSEAACPKHPPPTPPSQGGENKVARLPLSPPCEGGVRGGGGAYAVPVRLKAALVAAPIPAAAEPPALSRHVHVEADRAAGLISIQGLDQTALARIHGENATPARWASLCRVIVRSGAVSSGSHDVALTGSYRVTGSTLQFVSRYLLDQPGYRVRVDRSLLTAADLLRLAKEQPGSDGPLILDLYLAPPPGTPRPSTAVESVYPSAEVLPENLLRFYLQFSAPMSRGEAYSHIRLLNAAGRTVADPFLELNEELWSGDGRRFTLLFDPGRIKRGLKPREEAGPVLEAGKSYTLVIDRKWPDAHGNSLAGEYRKPFRAGPPDQESPSPRDWKIQAPAAGTRNPLQVGFPEPLDSALARRLIVVRDSQNRIVPGVVRLERAESLWLFTPDAAWPAGGYALDVGTDLEDLAGNAVGRPFEVDLAGPISVQVKAESISRPFRIEPKTR
jgi:hypothetical protein